MPVIREIKKIPSEYVDQYLKMGGCSRIGAEIWIVSPKRLEVGVISSIDEQGDRITVITKGKSLMLNPKDKILFTEPFYKIAKDLRK